MVSLDLIWKPNQCKNLLEQLYRSTQSDYEDIEHIIKEFDDIYNNNFFPLFHPKKFVEHRSLLKNGVVYINKVKNKVNDKFIGEIIAVSDELDLDEYLAAQIYSQVCQETTDKRSLVKLSIDAFYKERSYLLASLEFILINCNYNSIYKFNTIMKEIVRSISFIDASCYDIIGKADGFGVNSGSLNKSELDLLRTSTSRQQDNANDQELGFEFQRELLLKIKDSIDMESVVRKVSLKASVFLDANDEKRYNQIRLEEVQSLSRFYFLFIKNGSFHEDYITSLVDLLKLCEVPTTIFIHLLVSLLDYLNSVAMEIIYTRELSIDTANSLYNMYNKLIEQEWKLPSAKAYTLLHVICILENLLQTRFQVPETINEHMIQNELNNCYNQQPFQFATKYFFNHLNNSENITNITKCNQIDTSLNLEASISSQYSHSQKLLCHTIEYEFQHVVDKCITDFITLFFKIFSRNLINIYFNENKQLNSKLNAEPASAPTKLFRHTATNVLKDSFIFEDLFTLIALAFKNNPKESLGFLNEQFDNIRHFMTFTSNETPNIKLYSSCLLMLTHLSNNSECCDVILKIVDVKHHRIAQDSILNDPISKEITFWENIQAELLKYADEQMEEHKQEASRNSALTISVKSAPLTSVVKDRNVLIQRNLKLITRIFSQSESARKLSHPGLGPSLLHPLFKLLTYPVPTQVKGFVLESISSFITPLSDSPNSWEPLIWKIIEDLNLIPIKLAKFGTNSVQFKPDWDSEKNSLIKEIKNLESNIGAYYETIGLLKLIKNLVLVKQVPNLDSVSNGTNSIASSIPVQATTNFTHAVIHYLSFVVKDIFSTLFSGNFYNIFHVFDVLDSCLDIFHMVLSEFSTKFENYLIKRKASAKTIPEDLSILVYHPGFYVLTQILSGKQFIDTLAKILADGLTLDDYPVGTFMKLEFSLLQTLRILNIALNLQKPLICDVLPELYNVKTIDPSHFDLPTFSVINYLDEILLSRKPMEFLLNLVKYTNCDTNNEISQLSFELLGGLCDNKKTVALPGSSNAIKNVGISNKRNQNQLLQLVWIYPEFLDIRAHILNRLAPPFFKKPNLEVNYSRSNSSEVALTILEVINNSLKSGNGFCLGQFMLGFFDNSPNKSRSNLSISYEVVSPFHEIVKFSDKISGKIDRWSGIQTIHVPTSSFESKLINYSYEIVQKLSTSQETSTFTLKYLRTQHHFFLLHFDEIQAFVHPPEHSYNIVGRVHGNELRGQVSKVLDHVNRCSSLIEIAIEELESNYTSGLGELNIPLINKLFTVEAYSQKNNFINSSRPYYGYMSILNIHDVLATEWEINWAEFSKDEVSSILSHIQITTCKLPGTKNEYNIKLARNKFNTYIKEKLKQTAESSLTRIDTEIALMESYFSFLDIHQQLVKQQLHGLKVWERLLTLAINKGLPNLGKKLQIPIAFDLLKAFLQTFRFEHQPSSEYSEIYGEIINLLSHYLAIQFEEEIRTNNFLIEQNQPQLNLNLVVDIWVGLLHTILNTYPSPTTRLNLYSAIKYYFQYLTTFQIINPVVSLLADANNTCPLQLTYPQANKLVSVALNDAFHGTIQMQKGAYEFLTFLTPLFQFEDADGKGTTSTTVKVLLDKGGEVPLFNSLCKDISMLISEKELENQFELKMNFLAALATSNEGSYRLTYSKLFKLIGNTGLLNTQLDRLSKDDKDPLLRLAYRVVTPIISFIFTVLTNSGNDTFNIGKIISEIFVEYPGLIQSIFRIAHGPLTTQALTLVETAAHILCFYAERFRKSNPNDFPICGALHSLMLDLLIVFADRSVWLPRLKPTDLSSLAIQSSTDLLYPNTSIRTKHIEGIVTAINIHLMTYIEIIYDKESTIVSLSTPIAFTPEFYVGTANRSLGIDIKPSIKLLVSLFNETVEKLQIQLVSYKKLMELQGQDPSQLLEVAQILRRGRSEVVTGYKSDECLNQAKLEIENEIKTTTAIIFNLSFLAEVTSTQLFKHLDHFLNPNSPHYPFAKPKFLQQPNDQLLEFIRAINATLVPTLHLLSNPTKDIVEALTLGKLVWGDISLKNISDLLLKLIPSDSSFP